MQTYPSISEIQVLEFNKIADFVFSKLNYDVRVDTKSRKRGLVYARVLFFVIAHQKSKFSYEKTAAFLNKDHATFIHAFKLWDNVLKNEYEDYFFEYFPELDNRKKEEIIEEETICKITKLPQYIIEHLQEYSEQQLKQLYDTRLVMFKKMLDI